MADARDFAQVLVEADDIASAVGQRATTAHVLLAVFTVPCPAAELLKERGVDEDRVLAAMTEAPREPEQLRGDLVARAREIAAGLSAECDTLHLLIAASRLKESLACELLDRSGVQLSSLRNTILSWYTGGRMPRQYTAPTESVASTPAPPRPTPAPRPTTPARVVPALELSPDELIPDPLEGAERAIRAATADLRRAAEPAAPKEPITAPREPNRPLPPRAPSYAPPPLTSALGLEEFPNLAQLGRNLTKLAAESRLDPVIGREREVEEVVDIIGKRRGNNPVLVGEPGVGKTAIAEGVAQRLLQQARAANQPPKIVVELDVGGLVAGTSLRGAFSERLNGLKDEVRRANGRVIVFVDELHMLIGAGSTGEGAQDAANELKAALARGEFPCIGATTHDEYRKFIQQDPALERRFTAVLVKEPTVPETILILQGLVPRYAEHHGVRYEPAAVEAAAALSARYVHDRFLPDKAIGVLDLAGSRCHNAGQRVVDVRQIASVVARMAKLPEERLLVDDRERLLRLEQELGARVVGHGEVISKVASAVRRNYAGFAAKRPMGSFLFLGPTGVGKTELAKAIAGVLYGADDALVRLDMSEMSESHAVARLVGAPPGYVGYGDGGQLSEPVRRRPACVVLLDEIEKAHRDVLLLLLQVLDEGRLTDGRGRHVDFTQAIVVLTSNLGAEAMTSRGGGPVGFGTASAAASASGPSMRAQRSLDSARTQLPPELWNRIDERCVFRPLERDDVAGIARLLLADSARRLAAERGIRLTAGDEVIAHLLESGGFDATLGARPMRQAIQRLVEGPLAEAILRGVAREGDQLLAVLRDGEIAFVHA